jgi:hypothetical protein
MHTKIDICERLWTSNPSTIALLALVARRGYKGFPQCSKAIENYLT